jgi:hypothetical protein
MRSVLAGLMVSGVVLLLALLRFSHQNREAPIATAMLAHFTLYNWKFWALMLCSFGFGFFSWQFFAR